MTAAVKLSAPRHPHLDVRIPKSQPSTSARTNRTSACSRTCRLQVARRRTGGRTTATEDVERHFVLPVLGSIPHIANRQTEKTDKKGLLTSENKRPLFSFDGDDSVTTEAYRSLRTNLSFVSPDNPIKTLAVTSAGPGEGKSITIANLAMAYAQMGKKVLLVDTDLRRPVQHKIFNHKKENGFSDIFVEGNDDYRKCIRLTAHPSLWLLTAGTFTPNPAELLGSTKMEQLIEKLRAEFDIIFFDTPPIIAVTDAVVLGTKMDGLLLVVKSNHTEKTIGVRAVDILRKVGVRTIGVVLNDIDLSARYAAYGYYKYYYYYSRNTDKQKKQPSGK